MDEPTVAFAVRVHDAAPAIEVLVNFGLFAGREATRVEIDRLASRLLRDVGEVSIVAEERHQFDATVEAFVHVVRIEVPADRVEGNTDDLERRVVAHAEAWARDCIADRSLGI